MRHAVAEDHRAETGDVWRPGRGSHTSQTRYLTSAAIDAPDFVCARKDRETRLHLTAGTVVAITGGKHVVDSGAAFARLDKVHAKHSDMVLVHDGDPGVERHAVQWVDGLPAFQFTPECNIAQPLPVASHGGANGRRPKIPLQHLALCVSSIRNGREAVNEARHTCAV